MGVLARGDLFTIGLLRSCLRLNFLQAAKSQEQIEELGDGVRTAKARQVELEKL